MEEELTLEGDVLDLLVSDRLAEYVKARVQADWQRYRQQLVEEERAKGEHKGKASQ